MTKWEEGPIHATTGPEPAEVSEDIEMALVPLVPVELRDRKVILTASATEPRRIAGSQPEATCIACKQPVWVSPLTRPCLSEAVFLCSTCIEGALTQAAKAKGSRE